jgi:hypothetical protein
VTRAAGERIRWVDSQHDQGYAVEEYAGGEADERVRALACESIFELMGRMVGGWVWACGEGSGSRQDISLLPNEPSMVGGL